MSSRHRRTNCALLLGSLDSHREHTLAIEDVGSTIGVLGTDFVRAELYDLGEEVPVAQEPVDELAAFDDDCVFDQLWMVGSLTRRMRNLRSGGSREAKMSLA